MLYEAARLKKLCEKYKKNFIVNDRADLALAVKADGLHLGQDDMDIKTARKILGSGILIGKSTHNLKQLKEAVKEEIDYAAFGPVYATDSKEKPDPVTGLKNISRARKIAGKIPLFLIGGINLKNINDVLNAGGANIALIRALFTAQNPKAAALNFKKRLRKHA